jgi:hypothetical protein
VTGDSTYTIINPKIDFTGNGRNDFAGFGAAIMTAGNSNVTINNAKIVTRGAVRTALWTGGKSTTTVNNADIETFSGTLPADYKFSIAPGPMMEIPYGLGMSGNQRSTNLIDEATVTYNNSHIKAHGWGALSSDGGGPTRMFVNNSHIETIGSGYGAYANGDAHDHFSHCTFDVADVALVIGGNGSGTFTDETKVNSKRYGVFMHQGTGGSVLTIEKGSVFNTRLAAIEVKGRGGDVIINDAEIHAGNGVILQSMKNDDPIMAAMAAGHSPDMPGGGGPGGAAGGAPGGAPGGGPGGPGGAPGGPGGAPGGGPGGLAPGVAPAEKTYSGDVNALFKNATLNGDVYHAMKGKGDMNVHMENTTLTGAISISTTRPSSGQEPTKETFRSIGDVQNTPGAATDKYGLRLSLDEKSKWVVDKTCYLTSLTIANGAVITAPAGSSVTLLVDGTTTPIKAGVYTGNIEVRVAPGT